MAEVRSASVNEQIRAIEHWAASWSAHDMERLLPLFTEEVIYEDVSMGVMTRGASELRAFAEGVFSRFPESEQRRILSPTNSKIDAPRTSYWDMATYLKQLGLMPSV